MLLGPNARAALAAKKAAGAKLGNRVNIAEADVMDRRTLAKEADQFAATIRPMIEAIKAAGNVGLGSIAEILNARTSNPAPMRNISLRL